MNKAASGARYAAGVVYAVYGAAVFAATLALVTPCYFAIFVTSGKKAPHIAHSFSRVWAKVAYTFFLIRVRVTGKEHIDPKQTYVFVSNHRSLLDVPLAALACKNTFRFLAKEELTRIPGLGYIIRNLYVTVQRKDKDDRKRSKDKLLKSLHEGISIFIFAEGTRNKSSEPMLEMRDGAFSLAIDAQVPLAVLSIMNSDKHLPAKGFYNLLPGVIHAHWTTPIETKGMQDTDTEKLRLKAREIIVGHLDTHHAKT